MISLILLYECLEAVPSCCINGCLDEGHILWCAQLQQVENTRKKCFLCEERETEREREREGESEIAHITKLDRIVTTFTLTS